MALTLSSISMASARDQLNSHEVATEVCQTFLVNGRIIDLPAPLAVVSSLCHLVDQIQVIYQPIVLVNLSCQGRDST